MENEDMKDPKNVGDAHKAALQDIDLDEDLNMVPDPTDDLDEGELANFDNSDEKAFDAMEKNTLPPKNHDEE